MVETPFTHPSNTSAPLALVSLCSCICLRTPRRCWAQFISLLVPQCVGDDGVIYSIDLGGGGGRDDRKIHPSIHVWSWLPLLLYFCGRYAAVKLSFLGGWRRATFSMMVLICSIDLGEGEGTDDRKNHPSIYFWPWFPLLLYFFADTTPLLSLASLSDGTMLRWQYWCNSFFDLGGSWGWKDGNIYPSNHLLAPVVFW